MKRREFITLLGGAAAAWPLAARTQRSETIYSVAYLALVGDRDAMIVKQRLDELGYSEGRNLVFDFCSAQGHPERLPQLAAELVATNPDVMVAGFGTATAKAAQGATATIPVVFTSVGDPIGTGIRQEPEPARGECHRNSRSGHRHQQQTAASLDGYRPRYSDHRRTSEPGGAIYGRGIARVEDRR